MPPLPGPTIPMVMLTISWEDPYGPYCRAAIAGPEPEDEAIMVDQRLHPDTAYKTTQRSRCRPQSGRP
jgi:hypothetical protein